MFSQTDIIYCQALYTVLLLFSIIFITRIWKLSLLSFRIKQFFFEKLYNMFIILYKKTIAIEHPFNNNNM